MMSRAMHDRPGGRAPAILPPSTRSPAGARPLAAILAPGLHAAFDGCLSEALPADLAGLLERLDRSAPPIPQSVRRVP